MELTRANIATLVNEFYAAVRADPELGPVFTAALGEHWTTHLERMTDFWCAVMLKTGGFQGNVFGKHMRLTGIMPAHFERWLACFDATATRLFDAEDAAEFSANAHRIAASLQYGYFGKVIVD